MDAVFDAPWYKPHLRHQQRYLAFVDRYQHPLERSPDLSFLVGIVTLLKYHFDLETQLIVAWFIERMPDSVVAQMVSADKGKPNHFAQLFERIVTA